MKPPWSVRLSSVEEASLRTSVIIDLLACEFSASSVDRRRLRLRLLLLSGVDDLVEAAPEQSLPNEGKLARRPQALVAHDLAPRLIAGRLVRPFDEGEGDGLAVL